MRYLSYGLPPLRAKTCLQTLLTLQIRFVADRTLNTAHAPRSRTTE